MSLLDRLLGKSRPPIAKIKEMLAQARADRALAIDQVERAQRATGEERAVARVRGAKLPDGRAIAEARANLEMGTAEETALVAMLDEALREQAAEDEAALRAEAKKLNIARCEGQLGLVWGLRALLHQIQQAAHPPAGDQFTIDVVTPPCISRLQVIRDQLIHLGVQHNEAQAVTAADLGYEPFHAAGLPLPTDESAKSTAARISAALIAAGVMTASIKLPSPTKVQLPEQPLPPQPPPAEVDAQPPGPTNKQHREARRERDAAEAHQSKTEIEDARIAKMNFYGARNQGLEFFRRWADLTGRAGDEDVVRAIAEDVAHHERVKRIEADDAKARSAAAKA